MFERLRALPALTGVTALVFGSSAVLVTLNAILWDPSKNPREALIALAAGHVLVTAYVLARGGRFSAPEALVLTAAKLFMAGLLAWNTDSAGGAITHGAGLSLTGIYVMWFLHPLAGRVALFLGAAWWFAAILHQDEADLIPFAVSLLVQAFILTEVLSRIKRRMDRVARTDPLTGVLNRRGISEFLERELARSARHGEPLCVIVVDLDGLRIVNNTLGHAAGDALLATSSRHWRERIRRGDAIGRTGGDEFVFVMPSTTRLEADQLMERLARTSPAPWSAGVAMAEPGESVESVIRRADQLMYLQKAARQSV